MAKVNKPLTVARQELAEKIVNVINEAGLPAFVVAELLEQALTQTKQMSVMEYQRDAQEYAAQVAQEAQKEQEVQEAKK